MTCSSTFTARESARQVPQSRNNEFKGLSNYGQAIFASGQRHALWEPLLQINSFVSIELQHKRPGKQRAKTFGWARAMRLARTWRSGTNVAIERFCDWGVARLNDEGPFNR